MKPDWKDAPEWAQWLAQDSDGLWLWYSGKPTASKLLQWWRPNNHRVERVEGAITPNANWQQTLEKRPVNVEDKINALQAELDALRAAVQPKSLLATVFPDFTDQDLDSKFPGWTPAHDNCDTCPLYRIELAGGSIRLWVSEPNREDRARVYELQYLLQVYEVNKVVFSREDEDLEGLMDRLRCFVVKDYRMAVVSVKDLDLAELAKCVAHLVLEEQE